MCLLAGPLAYARVLPTGLLADDFALLSALRSDGFFVTFGGFFRPVTLLTFALDEALYGVWAPGYHLTNAVLHASVAAALAGLVGALDDEPDGGLSPRAWLTGAIFLVAPTHTEAVSWIAGRGDLLCALFGLLFLRATLDAERAASPRRHVLAIAALTCALLAKEAGVVLPFAAAILAQTAARRRGVPISRTTRSALAVAILVLVAYLAVRALVVGDLVGGYGAARYAPRADGRLAFALLKTFVRCVLPPTDVFAGGVGRALGCALAVVATALVALVVRHRGRDEARRGRRDAAALLACVLLSVLPVVTIGTNLSDTTGERLLYLPSTFALAALVALARGLPRAQILGVGAALVITYAITLDRVNLRWQRASAIAERVVAALERHAPDEAALVSLPDSYRGAYILRNGVDGATRLDDFERPLFGAPLFFVEGRDHARATVRVEPDALVIELGPGDRARDLHARVTVDGHRVRVPLDALPPGTHTALVYVGGDHTPLEAHTLPPR